MSKGSKTLYQLHLNEVYPRQALYGFQLSPDGQRFVFVQQRERRVEEVADGNNRKLKVIPSADLFYLPGSGGFPQPFTDSGKFPNPAVWSPDGEWLALEQEEQLILLAPDGSRQCVLYRGALYHPMGVLSTTPGSFGDACWGLPRWLPDGKSLLFATKTGDEVRLWQAGADGKTLCEIFADEVNLLGWDVSPDGQWAALVTRHEDGWTGDVRLVNLSDGSQRIVCEEDHYAYLQPVAVWASNVTLVVRSNRSGWSKLWAQRVDTREVRPLTSGAWDDYALRLSPDGKEAAFASRREQPGSGDDLWVCSVEGGAAQRITRQSGVNVPLAWSPQGEVFYWHSSPTEPGDLWAVSVKGGSPRRVTFSAPLELERKLPAVEETLIRGEDGALIPSLVYRPAYRQAGETYPPLVWIHGGPTMALRADFHPYCAWLANLGFIVIAPNYRGSIAHGVAHMNAVSGEGLGKNDLQDVLAAGRYARTLPDADLRRGVGVGGFSWGGYLTLMAVTNAPDAFSCAVAGAGISDWFIQQAFTEVRYYDRWLMGGWVYEEKERAHQRSPISLAGNVKIPLLVYHGESDTSVPFSQIGVFVEKARQAGADVRFVTFPLEGHSNRKPENQQTALDQTAQFFRQHLQPWNMKDNPSAGQLF